MEDERPTLPVPAARCRKPGCIANAPAEAPRGLCDLHDRETSAYARERARGHERAAQAAETGRSKRYHEAEAVHWRRIAERIDAVG